MINMEMGREHGMEQQCGEEAFFFFSFLSALLWGQGRVRLQFIRKLGMTMLAADEHKVWTTMRHESLSPSLSPSSPLSISLSLSLVFSHLLSPFAQPFFFTNFSWWQ